MIERFNFYDLYGYLIPGFMLLALLWFPFGLADETAFEVDWSSALLALVFGYVAGHLIQGLAISAFPSGRPRFPSDILLDDNDRTFSRDLKTHLAQQISQQFGIDVTDAGNSDVHVRGQRRADAFMLCRRSLIQKEVASYAEQFEGMYALMRGVAAACILALGYYLGFLSKTIFPTFLNSYKACLFGIVVTLIVVGLLLAIISNRRDELTSKVTKEKVQRYLFWLVVTVLYLSSTVLERQIAAALDSWTMLLPLCLVLALIAIRCYGAYKQFSVRFAETVYRDFCAHG